MGDVRIEEVSGFRGRLAFLRAAAALRREPPFTPDLAPEFLRQTSSRNPFFRQAEMALYLARRGARVVGRVAPVVDRVANSGAREEIVAFGYFEVADGDVEATRALVEASAEFGRARGARLLRGPIDLCTNYRIGLLVEGFERPPSILLPWNPPGHAALLASAGLRKAKDLIVMEVETGQIELERVDRIGARALERGGFTIRNLDRKRLPEELERCRSVFNASWAENWGFRPMTAEEFAYAAHDMRHIFRDGMGIVVEKEGRAVAFAASVLDIACVAQEIGGRLLPFGWLHLLRRLRTVDRMRVLLLGVLPEFRRSGIDAALYAQITIRGRAAGIRHGVFGWMLEDNVAIQRGVEACGARPTRRYRVYERSIGEGTGAQAP